MSQYANFSIEPQGPNMKNLFLAVLLSTAIFVVYGYFFPPVAPVAPGDDSAQMVEKGVGEPKKEQTPEVVAKTPNVKAHPLHTKAISEEKLIFDVPMGSENSSSYHITMTNIGGRVAYCNLNEFPDESLFDASIPKSSLISLYSKGSSSSLTKDSAYEIVDKGPEFVTFRHVTKEGIEVFRKWNFLKDNQVSESLSIKNISNVPQKLALALDFTKAETFKDKPGMFSPGLAADSFVVRYQKSKKHERLSLGDLKDVKTIEDFSYVGIDEQFFLLAMIPQELAFIEKIDVVAVDSKEEQKQIISADVVLKPVILMPNEQKHLDYKLFLGPKQIDLLQSINPPLDENIDFGWFAVISRPMLWLLVQIYSLVGNYGLAIILLTFIIKLLTYPLMSKSFASQQKMKEMQPQLQELKKKYAHDKNIFAQKQMELFKEHGTNPLSGCLTIFIQFPIWIALFQMLRNSVEIYHQPFILWIHDLTMPDPYYVLPLLMGVTLFVQQLFTPTPSDQPQAKYIMWFMPIFITLIMLNMPAGLSLYQFISNILSIIQQLVMKKRHGGELKEA